MRTTTAHPSLLRPAFVSDRTDSLLSAVSHEGPGALNSEPHQDHRRSEIGLSYVRRARGGGQHPRSPENSSAPPGRSLGVSAATEDYLRHYHKRSNVESTFSMVKRKFGDSLWSKTDTAMVNEALAKLLAHNAVVVIHEMYELEIDLTLGAKPRADEPRDVLRFVRRS
jgi:hypothetical protein